MHSDVILSSENYFYAQCAHESDKIKHELVQLWIKGTKCCSNVDLYTFYTVK